MSSPDNPDGEQLQAMSEGIKTDIDEHTAEIGPAAKRREQRVGELLRDWRKDAGLTLGTLSEWLDRSGMPIHPTAIAKLETGQRPIRMAEAFAICEILGVRPVTLLLPHLDEDRPDMIGELTESIERTMGDIEAIGTGLARSLASRAELAERIRERGAQHLRRGMVAEQIDPDVPRSADQDAPWGAAREAATPEQLAEIEAHRRPGDEPPF